jgi:hypothetical protein
MMKNKSFFCLSCTISFLLLFSHHSGAADDPCVCYKHKKTEAVLHNCTEFKGPDDYYITIRCKTKVVSGKKKLIDIKKEKYLKDEDWDKEWERIESGKTGCDPCEGRPEGPDIPKGGD